MKFHIFDAARNKGESRRMAKGPGIKKLYYSITEVSKLLGEEPYVLRYWETEFPQLRPKKNRAGNRIYTDKDIAILRAIQHLLRTERYTIEGAKERLKKFDPETGAFTVDTYSSDTPPISRADLQQIRSLLQEMLDWLRSLD